MRVSGTRTEVVSLAVYPETKAEWEDAAGEDPNADSLSQFIRVAVNNYLTDHSQQSTSTDAIHQNLAELHTQQDKLFARLDHEAVGGAEVSADTQALAQDIFECLPSKREAMSDPVIPPDQQSGVPAPVPGSIEWLTDQFTAPRYQIQSALDHLLATTYSVQQTDDGIYYTET